MPIARPAGFKARDGMSILHSRCDMTSYQEVPTYYENADQYEKDQTLLSDIITADELQQMVFPEPKYAIPGVIPEGYSLLSGAPKVGKSWFVLDLCIAKASGKKALQSLEVEAGDVLYVALEDGHRRLQSRVDQLMPGGLFPHRLHLHTQVAPGKIIETVEAWLRATPGASLIVIDTLGKVMPPKLMGESAYERDYRIGGHLHRLAGRRQGVSLVVVHHTRKAASEDFVDSSSGTNGLTGAADTVLIVNRRRLEDQAILSVTGRDIDEAEYGLERTASGSWQLIGNCLRSSAEAATGLRVAMTADRHGDRMREIVALVNTHAVTSPREVADRFSMDPRDASKYLQRAFEKNLIDKAGRGLYVPVHSVHKSTPWQDPV
jgi:predicted ATP-dependent serine protease